jgi:hypothetical protein
MEVRLRRQPGGCVYWPLTLMTFCLFALLKSMGERHFIKQMDEEGVWTRGGRRIAWNEFTGIVRSQGVMEETVLSDEYLLKSKKGKVSLPAWRTENAKECKDYLFQHLPPALLHKDS